MAQSKIAFGTSNVRTAFIEHTMPQREAKWH